MATFIQKIVASIDANVVAFASEGFNAVAAPVATTLQLGGIVALALIAVNTLLQVQPIRLSEYFTWGLRYVIVLSVATTWSQFEVFYNMITVVPDSVGAMLITTVDAPTLTAAMDEMVTNIFRFSDKATSTSSWIASALVGVVLWAAGAIMACIAVMVMAIAKLGLAFAVAVAPFFIGSLMFRATSSLFTAWSRFTLGFAMIPIVLAGVMGVVLGIAQEFVDGIGEKMTLADGAAFLIVALASIVLMAQIPTMVNGLAGSIVATASAAALAGTGRSAAGMAGAAGGAAVRTGRRQASHIGAAGKALADGEGAKEAGQAYLNDARRFREARAENQASVQQRNADRGHVPTWEEGREARRAGEMQEWVRMAKERDQRSEAAVAARDGAEKTPEAAPTSGPSQASAASAARPKLNIVGKD